MKTLIYMILLLALVANPFTLSWIASKYVVSDRLEPSDAVVPLRGAPEEERIRLEEAIQLVRKRYASTLLVSVSSRPYYGQSVRRLIEEFLQRQRFPLQQVRFCENNADNTAEEAQTIRACLQQAGARQAIIVTSEYHTRRTRFLFRKILSGSGISALIHPAYNSQYWDPRFWRRRRWTKTFVIETMALAWSAVEQWGLALRQKWPIAEGTPAQLRNNAAKEEVDEALLQSPEALISQ